jgi:DNA end-binding protein Ku
MYYGSEVRAIDEFRTDTTRIPDQELELATMLVHALAAPFEPTKYRDHYQESLRALLDAKAQGKVTEERVSKPALSPVVDILEALKASLARQRQPHPATPQKVSEERGLRRKRVLAGRPLMAAGRKIG